jgi:hypothetical protein
MIQVLHSGSGTSGLHGFFPHLGHMMQWLKHMPCESSGSPQPIRSHMFLFYHSYR